MSRSGDSPRTWGGTVVTDQNGWFSVEVYYDWRGTITPILAGYTFQPSRRPIGPVKGPSEESFVSKLKTFVISGSVGIDGVVLSGFHEPVYPDNRGAYKVTVDYGWTGVVTPQKEGYEFTPPDRSYDNVRADTSQTYRPAKSTYEVSGTITIGGNPIAGVDLDGFAGPVKTDPSGRYRFKVDHEWSATVTPLMEGYEFSPPSIRHDLVVSAQLGNDFYASQIQYSVTGNVGIGGVEIKGFRPGRVLSGPAGDFAVQVNHGQSIEVTPHLEGYRFTPPKVSLPKIKSDKTIPPFVAQEIFIKLTGTVAGIEGVELTGMLDRYGQTVYTGSRGTYTCEVAYNYSGTMMLAKEGYEFDPPGVAFNLLIRDKRDVFKAKKVKYIIRGNTGRQRDVLLEGFPATVRSDARGDYEVKVEYGFSATVTPKKEGLQFDPPYYVYEDVGTAMLQQDYEASEKEFIITGRVTGKDGPMPDVDILLGLADPKNTVTDAEGRYRISLPYNWKGKLQVAKPGHTFMPLLHEVFVGLKRDLTVDFRGQVKMMKITDILLDADGKALPQVMARADNGGTSMLSGVDGKFTVEVPYGWSGSISFLKPGIEFGESLYFDVIEDIDETVPI
ncbi:MAG: carboxypeptidase regulatory-like domain-containing protein, partial [Planctomycetes bacterium]|nr:carboxypeptidase regulatory-like domain-containing protein [Planctomycetota bacterium]